MIIAHNRRIFQGYDQDNNLTFTLLHAVDSESEHLDS